MARLIKRQKRPYWKFTNTVGKRIAVIALAFLMLFGLSMTIEAVREPVISFIENVFEKFSELEELRVVDPAKSVKETYSWNDLCQNYLPWASSYGETIYY